MSPLDWCLTLTRAGHVYSKPGRLDGELNTLSLLCSRLSTVSTSLSVSVRAFTSGPGGAQLRGHMGKGRTCQDCSTVRKLCNTI